MACTSGRMLLLATHFAIVHTATRDNWNPAITVSKPEADGTVYVTLKNPHEHAHEHKLCMRFAGIQCGGHVELQNGTDVVRYKVTNLKENHTYRILIKPVGENDLDLDVWVVASQTVFIPLGATPAPTTVTTTTAKGHVIERLVGNNHINLVQVGVPLMFLVVFCVGGTVLYCLVRTGYWRKILLLRCCGLRKHLAWDTPEILQLYVTENRQFSHFVVTHGNFMEKVLGVRIVDCQQASGTNNPERWMKSLTSTHHVLIYTSPILMSHIRIMQGEGSAEDLQDSLLQESQAKTHIQLCLEIIKLLCNSGEQRRRRLGRVGVVFVFSGCSDTDAEDEILLRRYFETVRHFTVVKQNSLEAPHSLVSHLSGGRNNVYVNLHTCDWAGSAEAEKLRGAATQLKRNNTHAPGVNNPPSGTGDAEWGSSESDVYADSDDTDENCVPDQSVGNARITLNVDVNGKDMDVSRTTVDHNDEDVTDRGCQDRPSITVTLNLISTQADQGQNVTYNTPINEVTSGTPAYRHSELGGLLERGARTQTSRQADTDALIRAHAHTDTDALIRAHAHTDTEAMLINESQSAVAMETPKLAAHTAPGSQLNSFHGKTKTGAVSVHTQGQNVYYTRSANAATRKTSAHKDSGFSSSATDGHGRSSVFGWSSLPVYSPGCQFHDEQSRHQIDDGMRNPPRWNQEQELLRGRNSADYEQKMVHGVTSILPERNRRRHVGESVCTATQASYAMSNEQRPLLGYSNRQHESRPVHEHNNLRHQHEPTQAPNILCHQQGVAMGYRMHQEEKLHPISSGTYHEHRPQQTPQNVYDKHRPQQNSNSMYDEHRPQQTPKNMSDKHRPPESSNNMHHKDSPARSFETMHHEHRPQQSLSNVLSVQATVHRSGSMLELHPGGLCVEQSCWQDASQRVSLLHDKDDFYPPEPYGSQVNILEQSRLLNENTEQHWSSNTG